MDYPDVEAKHVLSSLQLLLVSVYHSNRKEGHWDTEGCVGGMHTLLINTRRENLELCKVAGGLCCQ